MDNLAQVLSELAKAATQGNPTDFHLCIMPDAEIEPEGIFFAWVNMCGEITASLPASPSADEDAIEGTKDLESVIVWILRLIRKIVPRALLRYSFAWSTVPSSWVEGLSADDVANEAQSAVNMNGAFPYIIRNTNVARDGEIKFKFVAVTGGKRASRDKGIFELGNGSVLQAMGGSRDRTPSGRY